MGGCRRRSLLVLSVAVMLVPLGGILDCPSAARQVAAFSDGSAETAMEVGTGSNNSSLAILLPQYAYVLNSSLKVSTHAGGDPRAPENITLDFDGDGSVEWTFNGTGAGAFGFQSVFADGSSSTAMNFSQAGNRTVIVRLPRGATVTRASLGICGTLENITFKPVKVPGSRPYDYLGMSVAGIGDINRDGCDDIIVGAPGADAKLLTENGVATVYYGSPDGPQLSAGESVAGTENGDFLGFSVAGVRDFTKDGYGEILVGAPNATYRSGMGLPTPNTGVAYLYAFDGTRLRNIPSRIIPGQDTGAQMGFSVSEVGDIDHDGTADIAAGEILANKSVVFQYFGRVAVSRSADSTGVPYNIWGEAPYSFFGCFITKARDLDSDGKADFVVGAKFNTQAGVVGSAYVFLSRLDFKNPTVLMGNQPMSNFSSSGCTGDFNGDGFEDIALGAPDMNLGGKELGAVCIYAGGLKGPDPSAKPVMVWGRQDDSGFGTSVACPGDIDKDGTDDLLVGIPRLAKDMVVAPTGAVDLILTGRNRTITIWGDTTNENFGHCVAAAGDVNRDGFSDFIAGAPTFSTGLMDAAGRASIFLTQLSAPKNPKINVGGAGVNDWSWSGHYTRDATTADLSNKLNGILSNPMPVAIDDYGNEFVEIPIVVYSDGPGQLILHDLEISYNWTATVDINPDPSTGNLTWVLNGILTHERTEPPDCLIPLVFNASTPGTVRVHGLSIILDEAPVAKTPPILTLPEDSSDAYLLDLYTLFSDDYDPEDLLFWVDGYTNDSIVDVSITDWRWLSVDAFNGSANDNWTGEVRVTVSAQDNQWLDNITNITILITPVNDMPLITSTPAVNATAGVLYSYRMQAVDAENDSLSYGLAEGPEGMTFNSSTGLLEWMPGEAQYNRSWTVSLWASDGRLCATQGFSVFVGSRLNGVRISGTPAPSPTAVAGGEYSHPINASTNVANATLTYSLKRSPPGMTLGSSGVIRWVPAASQVGTTDVSVEVSDGPFTAKQDWTITVFPSGTPLSGIRCAIQAPLDGKKVSGKVNILGSSSITVGTVRSAQVSVDSGAWKDASGTLDWLFALDTTRLSDGRHTINARAFDGSNYSQGATVTVVVSNPPQANWLASPLFIGALIMIAAFSICIPAGLYLKRKKDRETPKATAPMAVTGEVAVDDIFLIHLDGRLIHHATRRLATGVDSDILSSMLTAVTSFVKDALSRTGDSALGSLEYGDSKILLERGRWTYLAVVISGRQEPPELRDEMRQVLRNFESEYGPILKEWDGDAATLADCKKLLGPLTAFSVAGVAAAAQLQPDAVDVEIMSELEFYQGYVRLKVAVKNSSPSFIMDSSLKVIYNDKALKLERVEPEYPVSGREIILGNIGIKEKKTVALYLDPQICMESYIEGTLTFKDAQGGLHHIDMKKKLASVVCPIMHTDENINIPMMRRMLEGELDQKDTKIFSLPAGLEIDRAFEMCKRAVQGHDIRLVREYVERTPVFVGEAWYYGMVKGRDDKIVVKTAVRSETGSADFYVASNSRLVVTGLLAELKNDLNREYKKERPSERPMEAMSDEDRREKVRKQGYLMDRHAEGEMAPGAASSSELKP